MASVEIDWQGMKQKPFGPGQKRPQKPEFFENNEPKIWPIVLERRTKIGHFQPMPEAFVSVQVFS